jgi:hypothetical protein
MFMGIEAALTSQANVPGRLPVRLSGSNDAAPDVQSIFSYYNDSTSGFYDLMERESTKALLLVESNRPSNLVPRFK